MAGDSRRRMSVTRRIMFGAVASWFSRGLTIVLGLVLMPVLFRHLPKEELGVWLLLGQSWAALGILDLGLGVTLTRRIALAKGKSGGDPDAPLTQETLREIADLTESGRRIYQLMSLGVFVVAWLAGFFYLRNLSLHEISHTTVWIAWTILCASQACAVWATVWTCLLQGVGYVGWDALIASLITTLTLTTQIIVVLCGGGLVALAAVATIGALGQRWLTRRLARIRRPELFSLRGCWNPEILRGMPSLAFRAWLTILGGVLVQNTDSFFIASLKGAGQIPAFRAAFLVVLNLHMVACVFASSSFVFVSHLWQAGQIGEVQRIIERNLRLGLSIMLCGGAAILASGQSLFDVWLGPSNYVGGTIVALFVATFVLEQQTFIISTGARATEDEAFAGVTVTGGILKLLFAFLLTKKFGLVGLACSTIVAQLPTAHWFVLYRGLRRLQFGFNRYVTSVLLPCVIVFVAACAASFFAATLTDPYSGWLKLGASSVSAGVALLVALWFLVLDRSQRARAGAFIGWPVSTQSLK
jgi:O-antigen/teichoic acid export membrane protein